MATSNSSSTSTASGPCPVCICPKFSYAVMLLGLIALAASGIGTFLFGQPPMTHWVLMLHVGASPLFTIGLTLVALTWPARCCGQSCATKFFFWLMLLAGFVTIMSGVIPMTPLFGTEGQHTLYLTHRISGIVTTIVVVLHLLTLRSKK